MNPPDEPDCVTYTKVASVLITERAVFQTTLFINLYKNPLADHAHRIVVCSDLCSCK